VRVIAGQAKGRSLASVPGTTTRPITDRVKTALFGILEPRLDGARFLDLFAGTGAVGIEALSRGAAEAWFIDRDAKAVRTVRENLASTGLSGSARVLRQDAFAFLRSSTRQFDIIHVAPPQYQELWLRALLDIDGSHLVAPEGLVVVQIFPKEYRDAPLEHLAMCDQRKYGSTMLCFYRPRTAVL
jgi:16S rRNA (guanine966-N2)-methyltransferase